MNELKSRRNSSILIGWIHLNVSPLNTFSDLTVGVIGAVHFMGNIEMLEKPIDRFI
jgi:hypothetical protein